MSQWIVVAVLYVLGMGCFHLLGGLGAAGEAFSRWGRAVAGSDRASGSSSSA
jgi:hypothetical protein